MTRKDRQGTSTSEPSRGGAAREGLVQALSDDGERKRRESQDAARFAVTRILGESADLAEATSGLLQALCQGMGWEQGELWTADEGDRLRRGGLWPGPLVAPSTGGDADRDRTLRRGEGLAGRVWAGGEPVWLVSAENGFLHPQVAGRSGLRSAVAVPLPGPSRVNGVLLFTDRRGEPPDPAALGQIADVGRQIGQFIERKRAEKEAAQLQGALERAAFEWRLTFDAIDSPILLVDAGGLLTRVNRAAQEAFARPFEDILGRPISTFAVAEPWKTSASLAIGVAVSRTPSTAHVRDDEDGRTWDVAATLLERAETPADRVIVVARDVTRTVDLQESLRRSETMSAMGALVAGVAHEVRNPLFSISANLDAFEAASGDRQEFHPTLEVLRREVGRLSALMQELLVYGRPVAVERCEGGLEEVMAEAVDACRSLAERNGVRIAGEVPPDSLPPVVMDRNRLVQVFQNLIENALQHSRPGDTVTLAARRVAQGDRVFVECAVEDSGPGFRDEDLPKLFEPFFTRRPGGTGLGLSIVARIVDAHGGRVTAANRGEGGAAMLVRLPCSRA